MHTDFAPALLTHLASGAISEAELRRARLAAEATNSRLDEALVELGLLTRAVLDQLASTLYDVRPVTTQDIPAVPLLIDLLPARYLAYARVVPLAIDTGTLLLGMERPFDDFAAKAVRLKTGLPIKRLLLSERDCALALSSLYGISTETPEADVDEGGFFASEADLQALKELASDAPVIRGVQDILRQAVEAGASDVHLKPTRTGATLQFRIDGELRLQQAPAASLVAAIVSRLKILASLDISERRLPQDGRMRLTIAGAPLDIRMSTMPTVYGEGVVLRLLSRTIRMTTLADLGFSPDIQLGLEKLFESPDGLVLVTGPTGSGKSTTLYAALHRLVRPGVNVVTIEDPVEYRLDGATQVQIDEKTGLTFPRVLRSMLRQDPDIILVGEIRDGETARIAIQAALTGHFVLATLHTNSALAAIPRLLDMGVEPYLLAAVLRGVLAQRLVRRVCKESAADHTACERCKGTGTHGRVAIGELALLDSGIVSAIAVDGIDAPTVHSHLAQAGFVPMKGDGERRVASGDITVRDLQETVGTYG